MKKKIFLFSMLLAASIALAGFFDDLPFYLVNKGGTTTINFRYPIDGVTLTNPTITPAITPIGATVAIIDRTALQANVTATLAYAVPSNGKYRVSCYEVVTQAATTSSTMPPCQYQFTDAETAVAESGTLTASLSGNTLGLISTPNTNFTQIIYAKAGTNINYLNAALYASSGATPMQFSLHFVVEYLGA